MPEFKFSDPSRYVYKPGDVFLGKDKAGREIGIEIEKHGIVVAATRTGKGASFIIPNLNRWPDSLVIIDPKGENFVETWRARLKLGHTVALIDPFGVAEVEEWARGLFKTSFNPLEGIGVYTPRARERINAIANALIVIHDEKHVDWVDGARKIISGIIAYTIIATPPEYHHLGTARDLLKMSDGELRARAVEMVQCDAIGGLASEAGRIIIKALDTPDKGLPPQILEKAISETSWIDSEELRSSITSSSFKLSDLIDNKLSVYLVLQPDDIETYAAYLRLFIQSLLGAITERGINSGCNCLFILDEFNSLGKFDKVAEIMGRMAGYGVHVVPIVQGIYQLQKLYGKEAVQTFFSNADFEMFFGDGDVVTNAYISQKIGNFTIMEVEIKRPVEPIIEDGKPQQSRRKYLYNSDGSIATTGFWRWKRPVSYYIDEIGAMRTFREKMTEYHAAMQWAGKPRLPESDIAPLCGKPSPGEVARSMIVFARAGDTFNLKLAPYFLEPTYIPKEQLAKDEKASRRANEKRKEKERRQEYQLKLVVDVLIEESIIKTEEKAIEIAKWLLSPEYENNVRFANYYKCRNFCARAEADATDFFREAFILEGIHHAPQLREMAKIWAGSETVDA